MADLRYFLSIYVHAHQTGNSVPPHIDAAARAVLATHPAIDGPAAPQEGRGLAAVEGKPGDEEWDALVERAWDKYKIVGHQGELFMYASNFDNALDLVRKELARWSHPTTPTPSHP